jgi:hypothetical protein
MALSIWSNSGGMAACWFPLRGQVLYANRAANEIAAALDGLRLGTSGLRALLSAEDAALQRLIRQACIDTGQGPRVGGRLAISRGSGRKPYTIQVMPLRPSHANFFNRPPAALVLIVDAERAAHLPPAAFHIFRLRGDVDSGQSPGSGLDREPVSRHVPFRHVCSVPFNRGICVKLR